MTDTRERFMEKVLIDPETACWIWQASRRRGYGRFWMDGCRFAHRVAWQLFVGPIPDGLTIDHLCHNKSCVNPDHLDPVTNSLNISRSWPLREERTHCKVGHEFTAENTGWIHPRNGKPAIRYCRACQLRRLREWRIRRKASA